MNKKTAIITYCGLLLHTTLLISLTQLDQYKQYLKKGTYDGAGNKDFKARDVTFEIAFEHFVTNNGKIVVELGTTRSFVHGGLPGCNLDDIRYWTPNNPENWDWGAGCFTRMAAECLSHIATEIHTVDLSGTHIRRSQIITAGFKNMYYHVCSSEDFLKRWPAHKKIDLLYVDTGDMTPIEPTAQLQLREVQLIVNRDLVSKNGIVVVDDIRNTTPQQYGETSELGKGKYSIPFLLEHGFKIIADEYQIILQKE